jgi:hypothetical protein
MEVNPMSITHTVRQTWTSPGGTDLQGTVTETANAERNSQLAIAGTTADQQFDLDFLYAKLKSCFLLSTIGLTIETNATDHAGGDIITLVANIPFYWCNSSGVTNPFTANVTTIYVTPGGSTAGTLDIRLLVDTTT